MNNEPEENKEKKPISEKKHLSTILNPLKTGEHSKYLNPRVAKFLKDPTYLGEIILNSIEKLEDSHLDAKERVMYVNTLKGIYVAIFGQKNINLDVDVNKALSADAVHKVYMEILGERAKRGEGNTLDEDEENVLPQSSNSETNGEEKEDKELTEDEDLEEQIEEEVFGK